MIYVLCFSALAFPAFAYVDPNTGGLIMQVIAPLLIILGVAWSTFRRKVKSFVIKIISYIHAER